jgi:catechol 2,3-dioxygenase-like lactoylglutathione lyase family enzyme
MPSSFLGINHLKIPVFDLEATKTFYSTVLPLKYVPKYDHFTPAHELFAIMLTHEATNLIVEFRHDPVNAEAQKGWDPVTWETETRQDLEDWGEWFEKCGIKHSKVFTGIKGWVIAAEDPDGKIVRLYCNEEHEWTDHPDKDEYWLGSVKA